MIDLPRTRVAQSPLLALAACLSAGIVSAHFLASSSQPFLIAAISLLASASSLASWFVLRHKPNVAVVFIGAAFVIAGVVLSLMGAGPMSPNRIARMFEDGLIHMGDPIELTATIEGQPEPAPDGFYLTVNAQRVRFKQTDRDVSGTVLLLARHSSAEVKAEYDSLELRHGGQIRLLVTLDREDDFRNPGVLPFTEYLERKGYEATGVIKSPLLIERLEDQRVFLPLAWLYEWRELLQQKFYRVFSPQTAGVLDAALLGNQHNISRQAAERFREGGTFHVLVISGLQIAFIGGLAVIVVGWFTRRRALQFLFAATFIWGYTIAVGADASVVRSAFMFTLVVLAPVISRRPNTLNGLGGAALALLVWRPADLFDPSFQLTFLSVLSIVALAVPLLGRMQAVGSWRPTHETPYPPDCARVFRTTSEILFWSERQWRAEIAGSNVSYQLIKTPWAARLERWRLQQPARLAATAIVVSLSVQLGMLPLLIIYFHRISLAALFLNVFVGVLMAALALVALAAILVSLVSSNLTVPLTVIVEKINWLMIHSVDPFAGYGAASYRVPHYHGWWASLYGLYFGLLIFLVAALMRWRPLALNPGPVNNARFFVRRVRLAGSMFFLLVAFFLLHPFASPRPDGKLHIDFLDVGQGDAALLTMPDGTTLMIDGGGRPNLDWNKSADDESEEPFVGDSRSIGERVVSEFLWARGLDRVDYLLATHADADHIDGLNDVARNFKVRSAIVARTPAKDPGYAQFAETMERLAVPVEKIGAGDVLHFGDVSALVCWPPAMNDDSSPSRNNDSIVLQLKYGAQTILFTGDVEKQAELAMVQAGLDLHSNVIKVAHHGSRTSSVAAFVAATRPAIAIISVGRTSIFGHPGQEVVARWRAASAQVMTTGERGTISVVVNGKELNVSSFIRH